MSAAHARSQAGRNPNAGPDARRRRGQQCTHRRIATSSALVKLMSLLLNVGDEGLNPIEFDLEHLLCSALRLDQDEGGRP